MPRRQSAMRVDSTAVQGEGSYVVLKPLTMGEARETQGVDGSEAFTLTETMIRAHLLEWNWCDEEGQPLPAPTDKTAFDGITVQELAWLANQLAGAAETRKN